MRSYENLTACSRVLGQEALRRSGAGSAESGVRSRCVQCYSKVSKNVE
jgi:hypothetical protein